MALGVGFASYNHFPTATLHFNSFYRQRYPEVVVDLSFEDRFVDLIEEGYDLAIRATSDPPPAGLIARPLRPVPFVSSPCSLDDNRHLSQQPTQRTINTLCSLNESGVVRLIGDYIDTGEDRAQVALQVSQSC